MVRVLQRFCTVLLQRSLATGLALNSNELCKQHNIRRRPHEECVSGLRGKDQVITTLAKLRELHRVHQEYFPLGRTLLFETPRSID